MAEIRIEHDLLGEKAVPADAYYGIQTQRAIENFHITGVPLSQYPELIRPSVCDQDTFPAGGIWRWVG